MQVKIKYLVPDLEKVKWMSEGNWIDLRCAEQTVMLKDEYKLIPLGICVQLPPGYEAYIVPRSSTFKKFGLIQANHFGVVDNKYSGNNDQWFFSCIALRDTIINKNDRICQFRINEIQPDFEIVEVDNLENQDRGGLGSTGIQ
jgi:dUTP pyrophosphatase